MEYQGSSNSAVIELATQILISNSLLQDIANNTGGGGGGENYLEQIRDLCEEIEEDTSLITTMNTNLEQIITELRAIESGNVNEALQYAIENNRGYKYVYLVNGSSSPRYGIIQTGSRPLYIERFYYDIGGITEQTPAFYMSIELLEALDPSPQQIDQEAMNLSRDQPNDPDARFRTFTVAPPLSRVLFSTFLSRTDQGDWNLDIRVPPLILAPNTWYCWRFTPQVSTSFVGNFGFYYYYKE